MPDSLWPYRLQRASLLCPPLSSRACSNSCPLSWWCHLTISCFQPDPACLNSLLRLMRLLSCWLHPCSSSQNCSFLSPFQPSEPRSDPCKVLSSISQSVTHAAGVLQGSLGERKRSRDQITVSHSALCFSSLEIHSYQFFKKKNVWLCLPLVISLL